MKKPLIIFTLAFGGLNLTSCMSDSCDVEGTWKATSTDVQSSRFSATIVELTKAEILNTSYEFLKEGKAIRANGTTGNKEEGTWKWNETGDEIILEFPGSAIENISMGDCSSSSFSASQRIPEDTAKAAVLSINTVFERQ
jgi:hypothetical protein